MNKILVWSTCDQMFWRANVDVGNIDILYAIISYITWFFKHLTYEFAYLPCFQLTTALLTFWAQYQFCLGISN